MVTIAPTLATPSAGLTSRQRVPSGASYCSLQGSCRDHLPDLYAWRRSGFFIQEHPPRLFLRAHQAGYSETRPLSRMRASSQALRGFYSQGARPPCPAYPCASTEPSWLLIFLLLPAWPCCAGFFYRCGHGS